MSPVSYHGTLLLQNIQGRLFLTVSMWWAALEPGDVLTGRVVSANAPKVSTKRSYHITKTGRLSPAREQSERELETLFVRDQEVVVFDIWQQDGTLLASALYQIDATHMTCIPYQDEAEEGLRSLTFTIKSHIIDQPYRGILLIDQRWATQYERGDTVVTLTLYLWWEALYRGDVVVIEPSHHGWMRSTKTSFFDARREQSMVEVKTFAIEEESESFHVSLESVTGGTLAHAFFRADSQARAVVDVYTSTDDMPRQLTFEVLKRGDAQTYTGKIRYRLCRHRGVLGYLDEFYEREDEALAACEQKGYPPDHVLRENQTRWHTWEQRTEVATEPLEKSK